MPIVNSQQLSPQRTGAWTWIEDSNGDQKIRDLTKKGCCWIHVRSVMIDRWMVICVVCCWKRFNQKKSEFKILVFWQSSYSVVWLVGVCTGINIHVKFEEWPKIVWIRHFVFCMFGLCHRKTLLPMQRSWKPLKTRWIHFNILRFWGVFLARNEYILISSFFVTRKFNQVRMMAMRIFFILIKVNLKMTMYKFQARLRRWKWGIILPLKGTLHNIQQKKQNRIRAFTSLQIFSLLKRT